MRKLGNELEEYRVKDDWVLETYGSFGNEKAGAFRVKVPYSGVELRIVASSGLGWDHVSVSVEGRCPTWAEMSFVKFMFFKDSETAMQLHVAVSEHINCHPHTLHLWRPHSAKIPLPPKLMV
jgi:hypothetical protein